jgi:hypothetical protein
LTAIRDDCAVFISGQNASVALRAVVARGIFQPASCHLCCFQGAGSAVARRSEFFVTPFRSLVLHGRASDLVLICALAYLIATWALTALSFRRAADADISEWIAAAAIAPGVQIPVIALLCLAPCRATADHSRDDNPLEASRIAWRTATVGVLAGIG